MHGEPVWPFRSIRLGRVEEIPGAIQDARSGEANVALNVLATPLFFQQSRSDFCEG